MPTTFGSLRDQIKQEARVKGTDELDDFVDDLIREVHDQHTERQRFSELFEPDTDLTFTDADGTVGLPEDFQHLSEVRYSTDGSAFRRIDLRGPYHRKWGNVGGPRFYEKLDGSIKFYPAADIRSTHFCQIDYYKKATLDNSSDNMPINKLVPAVRREVISRVHLYYKESQQASAFQQLTGQAITGIQSSHETGNK